MQLSQMSFDEESCVSVLFFLTAIVSQYQTGTSAQLNYVATCSPPVLHANNHIFHVRVPQVINHHLQTLNAVPSLPRQTSKLNFCNTSRVLQYVRM